MRWNRLIPIAADAFLAGASTETLLTMLAPANAMFCPDDEGFKNWTLVTGPYTLTVYNRTSLDKVLLKLAMCLGRDLWKYWTSDYASNNYALQSDGSVLAEFKAYGEGHVRMCAQGYTAFFEQPTDESVQTCIALGRTCPSINNATVGVPVLGSTSVTPAVGYKAYGLAHAFFRIRSNGIPCIYSWNDVISGLAIDEAVFFPTVLGTREEDLF